MVIGTARNVQLALVEEQYAVVEVVLDVCITVEEVVVVAWIALNEILSVEIVVEVTVVVRVLVLADSSSGAAIRLDDTRTPETRIAAARSA
jgi:hypothetical protein